MDKRYETMMGHGVSEEHIPEFPSLGPLSVRPYDEEIVKLVSPFVGAYTRKLGATVLSESGIDRATLGYTKYTAYPREKNRPYAFISGGGPLFSKMLAEVGLLGPHSIGHTMHRRQMLLSASSHPYTILQSADMMFLEAAGNGFQDGVARSAVLPGTDPRHFYGVMRDAAAFTAQIEHTINTEKLEDRPIVLIGASYAAGFRMVQVALNLLLRGIEVRALVPLNGHYDYSLLNYRQQTDPRPFVAALPVMAMAHAFHREQDSPPYEEIESESIRRYQSIAAWAREQYHQALTHPNSPRLRQEVARKMARLILPPPDSGSSLTLDYLLERDLRIDPVDYTGNYFPGRQKSIVEPRYANPELSDESHGLFIRSTGNDNEVTPYYHPSDETAVDVVFAHLLTEYQHYYSRYMNQEHVPHQVHQQAFSQWAFRGIWKQRRSQEAMELLLSTNQNIQIWHASGIYDLVMPPERARMFWLEMQQRTGAMVNFNTLLDNPPAPTKGKYRGYPTVDVRLFSMSHFLGGLQQSRDTVSIALNQFLRSLRAEP